MEEAPKFDKPFGQWVEEETPVKSIDVNPDTGKVSVQEKMVKSQSMYIHAPKTKLRCASGTHVFRLLDKHKYLFQCVNCPFVRQVFPTAYRFKIIDPVLETGILIHRYTGKTV